MKRKALKLISSILILLNLAGCWDAYDISQHTIVSLVGIGYQENKYKMTLEVINVSQNASSGEKSQNKSEVVFGIGSSIIEARSDVENKNPSELYTGAIRAVVFSGSYSTEIGITEYLSRIKGSHEYRKTISLVTSDTEMEALFDAELTDTESVGVSVENLIKFQYQNRTTYPSYATTILEHSLVKDIGYLLNNVELKGKKTELTGYSVFKNNKKIGFIPIEEKTGVNIFLLDRAHFIYTLPLEDSIISISGIVDKKKITVSYKDNITFHIDIKADCQILSQSMFNKISKDGIKELETRLSEKIKADILQATETSTQKFGCDYLFLYTDFRAKYNTAFKTMNYDEKYKKSNFNVNVQSSIVPGNMVKID
jgi:Ger(x)C family germination protein